MFARRALNGFYAEVRVSFEDRIKLISGISDPVCRNAADMDYRTAVGQGQSLGRLLHRHRDVPNCGAYPGTATVSYWHQAAQLRHAN